MSTDSELTGIMNANLPTNGVGGIDAAEHRSVVGAMILSKVSREDDATKLGLKNLDATRSYVVGEGFIYNGAIYQSIFGHSPGENPDSVGSATFQKITDTPTIESFAEWTSVGDYDTGDTIRKDYKLYESLIDNNINNNPSLESPLVNWVEISASETSVGEVYVSGTNYKKRQIVFYTPTLNFYWLNSTGANYTSTNFTTELASGIWKTLVNSIPAQSVTLDNASLVVAPEIQMQAFAQKIDSAVLRARGTGVSSTYVSAVSVGGVTFDQGEVFGEINGDQGYFDVGYEGITGVTVSSLSSASTFIYIDNAGALQQQTSQPTREDWVRKMFTMRIAMDTNSGTIIGFEYLNNPIGHYSNSLRDIYKVLIAQGVPFKEDQIVTGRSTDLGFDISAGTLTEFGGTGNIYKPNTKEFSLTQNAAFFLFDRTSFDAGGNTNLPKLWDNNGTLTALGSTTLVGHRLYRFSNGNLGLQYGQQNYANMSLARAGIILEDYVLNPALKNATFFGWWIIESTATNTGGTTLTDFREYTIGIQGGSSSGLSGCLLKGNNLSDLLDTALARTNIGLNTTANQTDSLNKRFMTDSQEEIVDAVTANLALKLNKALSEDSMFQGNASNEAVSVATNEFYPESHQGTTLFNQAYLISNWSSIFILNQKIENNSQVATKTLSDWKIEKKDPNESIKVDASLVTIWSGNETKILDVSSVLGADLVNLDTTVPSITISGVTQAATAVVTLVNDVVKFLKNDDLITISAVVGMTELNGNDYKIANINYTAKTFELNSTAGVATDSSGFTAYISAGLVNFTSGVFEPLIEEINGLPDYYKIKIEAVSNESPKFLQNNLATATSNQIITVGNLDQTLIGADQGSDIVTLWKKGSFVYSEILIYTK